MLPAEEEAIEVYEEINIASYATTVPTLVLWIWEFTKIMRKKDRAKFFGLIVICVLMILS